MARLNKTLRFALPAAVLLVAIGIYLWLEATRPQLSPVDSDERTWSRFTRIALGKRAWTLLYRAVWLPNKLL